MRAAVQMRIEFFDGVTVRVHDVQSGIYFSGNTLALVTCVIAAAHAILIYCYVRARMSGISQRSTSSHKLVVYSFNHSLAIVFKNPPAVMQSQLRSAL
jgi:hypothetical protein